MCILNKKGTCRVPEYQSSLVRLGIWCFAVIYVYVSASSGRYVVDIYSFTALFGLYLLFFVGFLISKIIRPIWEERRYVSLLVDVSAATCCIYLTGEASSPFFLLYIWVFVSYGTHHGRLYLNMASILSVLSYSAVVTLLDQWGEYFFEASFVLLALGALPIYQHSLISQLHSARHDAETSNLAVGKFLSNITSDMRGPLGEIVATSKELKTSKLDMWQLDKIDEINSSASILDTVIGDVLDFCKLESRQLQIQSVPFEVHVLVSEVCSTVLKSALLRQVELVCSVAQDVPRIIVGDEQRLKQVLTNNIKSVLDHYSDGELFVGVRIDDSSRNMLLFEIKGVTLAQYDGEKTTDDNSSATGDAMYKSSEIGADMGEDFASNLIALMGGESGAGTGEDGVISWFSIPAEAGDFEADSGRESPGLLGKKAFIFEPNQTSRDLIVACCKDQGMVVETVDKVSELGSMAAGSGKNQDIDIVIIADSPQGRNVARIASVCLDIFGSDLPLVILAYRRSCIDLSEFGSVALIRKPFIQNQLLDAMESVLSDV